MALCLLETPKNVVKIPGLSHIDEKKPTVTVYFIDLCDHISVVKMASPGCFQSSPSSDDEPPSVISKRLKKGVTLKEQRKRQRKRKTTEEHGECSHFGHRE